jgi:hypothetical protein
MISCDACHKVYSTPYNLKKHLKRQPLCDRWINMKPGLKDFVDEKIRTPKDETTMCMSCNTVFANVGNLNRHLATSTICSKWDLYNDLAPVLGYIGKSYHEFEAPKYSLAHIIWNVYLVDKEFIKKDDIADILKENNVKYVIGIVPTDVDEICMMAPGVEYYRMTYNGHNMDIDRAQFDEQCKKIEEYRQRRENVFLFCNNGYQRSIPFLTYYLCHHHADEIPTIEMAIDTILPQVDKENYSKLRNEYIDKMRELQIN